MNATLLRITCAATVLVACLLPPSAAATPSILGTFVGAFSGTEFDCRSTAMGPVVEAGPFADTFTLTLTIDDQQGNNFTGSGSTNDDDSVSVSGTISDTGQVSGMFTATDVDGDSSSGYLEGTLSGDTLTIDNLWGPDDSSSDSLLCDFQYSGVMSRSANTSNPKVTASSNITTVPALKSFTRLFTQSLTQRFNVFRNGGSGGASAVSNGFMLQGNGMAAGEGMASPVGVWGSFSYTDSEDDSAAQTFDSERKQFLGGVDISPWKDVIVGVALGYEDSDVNTPVNGGSQDIDGFTAAPYVAVLLNDTFSIDMSVGIASIDIKQSRVLAGTTISSKVDSTRTFFSGNINASRTFGNVLLTGILGGLYARDSQDSFIESGGGLSINNAARSFRLGQVRLGAEASWLLGEFEPFAALTLEHDYSTTSAAGGPNDDNGGVAGIGLRYFGIKNNVSGSLDYQAVIGRKNLDEGTFSMSLRVTF